MSFIFREYHVIITRSLRVARLANILGLKTIFDSHRPKGTSTSDSKADERLEHLVFTHKNTIRIVSTTQNGAKWFKKKYGSFVVNKVIVGRNGANLYDLNNKISLDSRYMSHVGYFGQLYLGKGMDIVSGLIKQHPNALFHIAGGPKKLELSWHKELKDFPNARFYGYLNQSRLIELRNSCDILLAPYHPFVTVASGIKIDHSYSSPIKLFEYMASNKPIIASKNPEIMEVFTNEENALLANIDDLGEWSMHLKTLQSNKELQHRLAEKAYVDFKSKYTWEERAKTFLLDLHF
jgi:glycosyltransferase involved in cell wall biosynthesis